MSVTLHGLGMEHVPRGSDSMGLYARPVPRIRSPHRTRGQLRAESAPIALNPYVPAAAGNVDELLAYGAKKIAMKRLITGHSEMNTRFTFELRDKKLSGNMRRRDLIRCCRSLDLGWSKEQLALIADRFQLAKNSDRCVYAGLVSALHKDDPRKQAQKRAQAVARAEAKAANAVAALAQQRADEPQQPDERAPLSVPTCGPLTQPLSEPVLVGGNWRVSPKRPDRCQIGYDRSRPGRRAYIETTREATNSVSIPAWDNSMTGGSGSVRENATTHGDRHFPVRQLLTPREKMSNLKVDAASLSDLRHSRARQQSPASTGSAGEAFRVMSGTGSGTKSDNGTACAPTVAQLDRQMPSSSVREFEAPLQQLLDSNHPVKVDMAVQAELEGPPELQSEPQAQPSETLAWSEAIAAVDRLGWSSSELSEWHPTKSQPGSRDMMWEMSELEQKVSLELLGLKLFNKLPIPTQGHRKVRAPYVRITYAHRVWKSKRAKKPTGRSRQSLSAERLRPETPEELSKLRKAKDETSKMLNSTALDNVHLSPRTGAYVDIDSPLSQHTRPELMTRQKKRELSQLNGTAPRLDQTDASEGLNSSLSNGIPSRHGPWGQGTAGARISPKKEWAWTWRAAQCFWHLMDGPGGPPELSIDLFADNERGSDGRIGGVSVSLNELIAGCASGEPMWLRIFSTSRGTRTHKWQGSAEFRPEEEGDGWNLPELKTTTHAAIGAVKVRLSAPAGWQSVPQRQKLFSTASLVPFAMEQDDEASHAQQDIVEDDDKNGNSSDSA